MKILILLLSILPIILIAIYFYKKDIHKEPIKLLQKLFISGIIAGLLVIVISLIYNYLIPNYQNITSNKYLNMFIYSFIFVSLIEEIFKFIMIYIVSYNNPEYDEFYDIILYSVFVALGFACFENLLYTLPNNNIYVAITRGLTAIPAHACYQTSMGYYLTLSKFYPNKKRLYIILSIIIPIILHGFYDVLLYLGNIIFVIIFVIFLITMFVLTITNANKIANIDKKHLN